MTMHGDSWRWNTSRHPYPSSTSMSVIEPPKRRDASASGRRLPFGFGRVLLHDEEPPVTARSFPG